MRRSLHSVFPVVCMLQIGGQFALAQEDGTWAHIPDPVLTDVCEYALVVSWAAVCRSSGQHCGTSTVPPRRKTGGKLQTGFLEDPSLRHSIWDFAQRDMNMKTISECLFVCQWSKMSILCASE